MLLGAGLAVAQPAQMGNWEQSGAPMPPGSEAGSKGGNAFSSSGKPVDKVPPSTFPVGDAQAAGQAQAWAEPAMSFEDEEDGERHGKAYRLWVRPEYLLWWSKSGPSPTPLVTTGSTTGLGILGQPDTVTVLGGTSLGYPGQSGARVTGGLWCDPQGMVGLEGSGFILSRVSNSGNAASDLTGNPILSQPVINALTGQEAVVNVAFPGAFAGGVSVTSSTQLWGAEANFVGSLLRGSCYSADMLLGFRYATLQEDFGVSSSTFLLPSGVAGFDGTTITGGNQLFVSDLFETSNDFYGGQLGLRGEVRWSHFILTLSSKFAVGDSHEEVRINGTSTLVAPGVTQSVPGGLYAVSSNIGKHTSDRVTFLPEGEVRLGFLVTHQLCVYLGYDYLYWFDVVRPGNQVDRTINPNLVPTNLAFGMPGGPANPAFAFQRSDYWVQGLTVGFELRY
jgi:hypothetical protein